MKDESDGTSRGGVALLSRFGSAVSCRASLLVRKLNLTSIAQRCRKSPCLTSSEADPAWFG